MSIQDSLSLNVQQVRSSVQLNRLDNAQGLSTQEDAKLREACKDFEAILIKQMLDAMRKTVPESSLLERNQGQDIFEDMLYQEYAEQMADSQSIGISDMMYRQMVIQNKGDLY